LPYLKDIAADMGYRVMWNLLINRTPPHFRSSDEHGREERRLTGIMQDGMICAQRNLVDCRIGVAYPSGDVERHSIAPTIPVRPPEPGEMAGDLVPFRRLKTAGSDGFPRAAFN
jgi:hypothetical protein